MVTYIIQTLWNQDRKQLDSKLIDEIRQTCADHDSVEFLGIYEPLIENWEWTFFLKTHQISDWE